MTSYTVQQWKELLARLQYSKTNGPKDEELGICQGHIDTYMLHALWSSWPKFTGRPCYPIPHENFECDTAFFKYKNLWDKTDPYCALRWELVDWLIDQVEIQLSKT